MFAHPKLTRQRRWKRRFKAAASIAIALAAGTFLACQRQVASVLGDAGGGAGGSDAAKDGPAADAALDVAAQTEVEAGADAADGALAVADARADARGRPRDAAVDVNEHRKGMPVPDNLLE